LRPTRLSRKETAKKEKRIQSSNAVKLDCITNLPSALFDLASQSSDLIKDFLQNLQLFIFHGLTPQGVIHFIASANSTFA
jgi:hypothetical protein